MKIFVIINLGSGSNGNGSKSGRVEEIRSEFEKTGIEPDIRVVEGPKLLKEAELIMKFSPDVIVAAGGDGTVSAIASALAGSEIPLGVLPLGTLNHFAKDLNISLELEDAVKVIHQKQTTKVDIGKVNEKCFVNNASIGVYPWVVKQRDSGKPQTKVGKYVAMTGAWISCLRYFPLSRVKIKFDNDQALHLKTPFIFIGNNEYEVNPVGFGNRHRLNSGKFCIYTVKHDGRWGLLRLASSILRGNLRKEGTFEMHLMSSIKIIAKSRELSVALDGEVMSLKTPLQFKIEPAALNVVVPGEQ
ncbi:MAG: diacylglycerol kinase family protein [Balneolaceae bacterium]